MKISRIDTHFFLQFKDSLQDARKKLRVFNREHGYVDDIRILINKDAAEDRVIYSLLAPIGMLFSGFLQPIGVPFQNENFCFPNAVKRKIYDNAYGEWTWFNRDLYDSIPPTFTFAPRPIDVEMELDYFVRSFGLPKHKFIWSDGIKAIPIDQFASIFSTKNDIFRGRYTFTPWMPPIASLSKLSFGHYIIDKDDYETIFNIKL